MVDFFYFTEMPYPEAPELDKYPAIRLTYPNRYFNPEVGVRIYREYLDQFAWAEEVGFDGVMVNEHHNTPTCLDVSCNISAAAITQRTRKCKILLLGNTIALWENPVRLAEEVAMLDLFSGGRIISGFVRGIGVEHWATNLSPVVNRERFEESHDLIVRTWTEPGPFSWEGKHFQFRYVNPWLFPLQKPHPPIWVPGIGSEETIRWAARHGYPYVVIYSPMELAEQLFALYRETAQEAGYSTQPHHLGYTMGCFVGDDEKAVQRSYEHVMFRMRMSAKGPVQHYAPVGMSSRSVSSRFAGQSKSKSIFQMSIEELREAGGFIVGTPEVVAERLCYVIKRLGIGHLIMEGQFSGLPHELAMRSIELLGKQVLPAVRRELGQSEPLAAGVSS
jgi:alkanesulfonate monooxygenase SsuD/methylene tetrahydromethanopterin reductase-like flavin-dependent oxidoreductase (luciferase family)